MYLEKFRLDGRTAVVTGGGQGIGLACAEALGEAGARVVIAELLGERVEGAVEQLKKRGVEAHGAALDVTRSDAVETLAERVEH
ncbi:MAG: SDR family NAD(P)-dependent oxidoreductase, partial [Pseudomonadota bacterium]|nr:SDR family NAD(P)-dependent oxidoreductase [Pseudomonadota bacterium]